MRFSIVPVFLVLFFMLTACGSSDDSSSDSSPADDDATPIDDDADDDDSIDDDNQDDDLVDDDNLNDDATDDDIVDDDIVDDDMVDDDTVDDDTVDDDTMPVDPYADMAPAGKKIDDLLAISSHMSNSTGYSWHREFEIGKLDAAGVHKLRTDFSWGTIEPNDDEWHFDGYDTMVDLCLESGIQVDALLDYGVSWAMPGGSHSEIAPEVWADFNGAVAAHFADRIAIYEIWNEENTERFWKPEPDPEHYGTLLKAGYNAIHDNDADAEVVFGGLSSFDGYVFSDMGLWNFIVRVAEEHPDICDYFDSMAIHPYTFLQQTNPEKTLDFGFWVWPNLVESIDHARDLLDQIGCPDKPIHLTEIGWPHYLIGMERQAAYLPRSLMLAAGRQVASYFWYTFWDGSGSAFPPTEDTFGLFGYPPENEIEKADYRALVAVHTLLGEAQYAGDLGAAMNWEQGLYALAFVDANGVWTVGLWHDDANVGIHRDVAVPLHPDSDGAWELYDQEGTLLDQGTAENGEVEVSVSGAASYLRFAVTSASTDR